MPRTKAQAAATPDLPHKETDGITPASTRAAAGATAQPRSTDAPAPDPSPAPARPSKLDHLVALLGRPEGATLAEMMAATGWQAHSVRGALAGSLRRKGHSVASQKVEGIRRYRIDEAGQ